MPAAIDLTGRVVGRLKVLRLERRVAKGAHARGWECECECGRTVWCTSSRLGQSLKLGLMSSCGLCHMPLVGKTYGRLTVVAEIARRRGMKYRKFRCVCACGKRVTTYSASLLNGHTKSCGCIRRGVKPARRKPEGFAAQSVVIGKYRGNAKKKGNDYTLTREQAIELFKANCWYCGAAPARIVRRSDSDRYGGFVYNGIDRVDNDRGYVPGNVVPCCTECNYRKGGQSYTDFVRWIRDVAAHAVFERSPPHRPPDVQGNTGFTGFCLPRR